MGKEETRKGPWTEEEDGQLVRSVELMGDRRWDFIAQISGLKRTGKSCRLRWVNYLNPCLKRGRISPLEERLILDLHSRWGNRWSRIARRLPGRTDNEIKNYWRTQMRKKKASQGGRTKATASGEPKSETAEEIPPLMPTLPANWEGFSLMPSPLWDYVEEEFPLWDLDEDPAKFFPSSVFF